MIANVPEITQLMSDCDSEIGSEGEQRRRQTRHRRDESEEPDETLDVAAESPRRNSSADDQADELERLGDGGGNAAATLAEAELLLVEKPCDHDEADQRGGEERQAPPEPM